MKLLCIADEECKALWDYYTPDKIEGVDLIIACGDLNRQYLEYLATMAPVPFLYVHGNHDENYDHHPPEGAICLDDDLFVYHGLRIVGLGGSLPLPHRCLAVYRGRDAQAHQPPAGQDRPPRRV